MDKMHCLELPYKRELPDDILKIIKEYSMPVTRPDWRRLHIMSYTQYLTDYYIEYKKRKRNKLRFQRMHNHFMTVRYLRYNIFSEYNYSRIIYHT